MEREGCDSCETLLFVSGGRVSFPKVVSAHRHLRSRPSAFHLALHLRPLPRHCLVLQRSHKTAPTHSLPSPSQPCNVPCPSYAPGQQIYCPFRFRKINTRGIAKLL